jgi:putative SOS response-associated peptidase YedK
MCGRFTQNYTWDEVHAFLSVFGTPRNLQPHYNIAPTDTVDVKLRAVGLGSAHMHVAENLLASCLGQLPR